MFCECKGLTRCMRNFNATYVALHVFVYMYNQYIRYIERIGVVVINVLGSIFRW